MNKLLLIAGLFLLTVFTPTWGMNDEPEQQITLQQGTSTGSQNTDPRSLLDIPFNCYYKNGIVYLKNESGIEITNFKVTDLAGGECWNIQPGTIEISSLLTSSNSGTYLVEIYTISNKYYFGYYSLE